MHRLVLASLGAAALSACDGYMEIGKQAAPGAHGTATIDGNDAVPGDAGAGDAAASDGSASPSADAASRDVFQESAAPTILWSTGAESGDFSDWERDGPAMGGVFQSRVQASVSQERAHSGTSSMKLVFDSSDNQGHMAEFYRLAETGPAYYGAWFFIDESHAPRQYWTLFYFFFEREAGNRATRQGLWDLNLNKLTLYFYDEIAARWVDATPQKPFPFGQWAHVEVYFAYEPPKNGHLRAWLDGELILDVTDLGRAPSDNLYWGIGSDTNGLSPPACTIYVDDATISTARLGP